MIDCKLTKNYFMEKKRMTERKKYVCKIDCGNCPLSSSNNDINISCTSLETDYPDKAIEIVQRWSDEHPQKTYLTDLLEKYPDVPLAKNGYPSICPHHLGYTKEDYINCGSSTCQQCWNTPVVEESEVKK